MCVNFTEDRRKGRKEDEKKGRGLKRKMDIKEQIKTEKKYKSVATSAGA